MAKKTKIDQSSSEDAVEVVSIEGDQPEPVIEASEDESSVEETLDQEIDSQAPTKERGTIMPMLIGGILCAAIGFAAAHYLMPGGIFFPSENLQIVALKEQLKKAEENVALNLAAQADAMKTQATDLSGEVTALNAQIAKSNADLEGRIATIENRPIADTNAQVQAALQSYVAELARVNSVLDGQGAEISGFQSRVADLESQLAGKLASVAAQSEEAALAEKQAQLRGQFNALSGQIDTGRSFGDTLAAIVQLSGNAAPAELSGNANGVSTLSSLQSEFPIVARAALAVAIAETADETTMGRFSAFLKSQTGARSLTAQEGSDPDAVLSRAEAALKDGDVQTAVDTLTALPAGGAGKMAGWVANAQAYADVQVGFSAYSNLTLPN